MFVEFPKRLHHPERKEPSVTVYDETEELAKLHEWNVLKADAIIAEDPGRANLLARAVKVELKVDNRWSDRRLLREIEQAENEIH